MFGIKGITDILDGSIDASFRNVLQHILSESGFGIHLKANEITGLNSATIIDREGTEILTYDFPQDDPWNWRKDLVIYLFTMGIDFLKQKRIAPIVATK